MLEHKKIGAITLFLILALFYVPGTAGAQSSVGVTVDQTTPGQTVSPDFEGFSVEMLLAFPDGSGNYLFSGNNTALIGMFKSLGIKSLRMGGNSADNVADNNGQLPIDATCAAADKCPNADSLYAFAQAAGVNVLFTLRLKVYDPNAAAVEAGYIMKHYASLTKCFQVGNEPNVFIGSYSTYDTDFKAYRSAVLNVAPTATFCAPAVTNGGGQPWAESFATEYKGDPTIQLICGHYYPGARTGTITGDINYILDPSRLVGGANNYTQYYNNFPSFAVAAGETWRLEETNSLVSQGETGVSDVYTSTLWALDYQHWWAQQHNAGGLNFHEGASSVYNAFVPTTLSSSYTARPVAYGIKAFSLGGAGQNVTTTVSSNPNSVNITAYGLLDPTTGNLFVTLINKEHFTGAKNATVTLNPGTAYTGGKVWALQQTSGDVTVATGITLGSATIGGDGTWNGTASTISPASSGDFIISVPAASAAIVELTGKGTPPPPPQPPSNLAASAISSSQINLSWTPSPTSGVTYSIFRSTTPGFTPSSGNQIASGVSTTSFSDTTASCNTTYFYLVEAANVGGTSAPANQASATTQACIAMSVQINSGGPAVSPFVADEFFAGGGTINHANTIDLSGVTNPAPMAVYQTARTGNFTYTIPGFSPGSSQTVRLHFAETFFSTTGSRVFNVSINGTQVLTNFDIVAAAGAKNKAVVEQFNGEAANSSGQYVITFTSVVNNSLVSGIEITSGAVCNIPTAPSGLSATGVSASQINLSWTASTSNCTPTYNVFRSTTSGFTPSSSNQVVSGIMGTSFSDTGLAASTPYFYLVEATDSAGTSGPSNQASATTLASCTTVPTPPSGLSATAVSSSQINLSWTASTASGCTVTYNVFRSTTSGFTPSSSNQVASGVTGTAFSDTGLAASTTYFYLVEATDSAGTSGPSNQASATTIILQCFCINAGGPAVSSFLADQDFAGGGTINHANTIDLSGVTNPAPMAVYQTARVGNFTYTLPGFAAGSSHTVRLHFTETFFSTTGSRTFNVSINGTQVLTNFDIVAAAGAKNKAVIEQFTENANSSGQYVIQFSSVVNQSLVSGIEIQ